MSCPFMPLHDQNAPNPHRGNQLNQPYQTAHTNQTNNQSNNQSNNHGNNQPNQSNNHSNAHSNGPTGYPMYSPKIGSRNISSNSAGSHHSSQSRNHSTSHSSHSYQSTSQSSNQSNPPVDYWANMNVPILDTMPKIDFLPDSVFIVRDRDFRIVECNDVAARTFGYDQAPNPAANQPNTAATIEQLIDGCRQDRFHITSHPAYVAPIPISQSSSNQLVTNSPTHNHQLTMGHSINQSLTHSLNQSTNQSNQPTNQSGKHLLIGQSVNILLPVQFAHTHSDQVQSVFANMQPKAMGSRKIVRGLRMNGSEFDISVQLSPVIIQVHGFDHYEKVVICVCRDMEDYNRNLSLRHEAERRSEAMQKFLRTMNHEVRTAIHAITNAVHELKLDLTSYIGNSLNLSINAANQAANQLISHQSFSNSQSNLSIDQSIEQLVGHVMERTEGHKRHLTDHSLDQSMKQAKRPRSINTERDNQSAGQSINQSFPDFDSLTNHPMFDDDSYDQSVSQSFNQAYNQSVEQSSQHSITHTATITFNQTTQSGETANQSTIQSNQSINLPTNSPIATLRSLRILDTGVNAMESMLTNMLDYQHLMDNHFLTAYSVIDTRQLFHQLKQNNYSRWRMNNQTIYTSVEPNVPLVYIESQHLIKVLNCLMDNALKHTGNGAKILLYCRVKDQSINQTNNPHNLAPGEIENEAMAIDNYDQSLNQLNNAQPLTRGASYNQNQSNNQQKIVLSRTKSNQPRARTAPPSAAPSINQSLDQSLSGSPRSGHMTINPAPVSPPISDPSQITYAAQRILCRMRSEPSFFPSTTQAPYTPDGSVTPRPSHPPTDQFKLPNGASNDQSSDPSALTSAPSFDQHTNQSINQFEHSDLFDYTTLEYFICDDGVGLSEFALDSLEQSIYESDASTTRSTSGGLGLGFKIATLCTQAMNASLTLINRKDMGAVNAKEIRQVMERLERVHQSTNDPSMSSSLGDSSPNQSIDPPLFDFFKTQFKLTVNALTVKTPQNPINEPINQLLTHETDESIHQVINESNIELYNQTIIASINPSHNQSTDVITNGQLINQSLINQTINQSNSQSNSRVSSPFIRPIPQPTPQPSSRHLNQPTVQVSDSFSLGAFASPSVQDEMINRLMSSEFYPQRRAMKLLIVDDNSINLKVLQRTLHRRDFVNTTIAVNGQLAVNQSLQHKFDAILMDLEMPVMDGITAARIITQDPANPSSSPLNQPIGQTTNPNARTPIIALTANATNIAQSHCRAAGMTFYLTKPLKAESLLLTLAALEPFKFYPWQFCPHALTAM